MERGDRNGIGEKGRRRVTFSKGQNLRWKGGLQCLIDGGSNQWGPGGGEKKGLRQPGKTQL